MEPSPTCFKVMNEILFLKFSPAGDMQIQDKIRPVARREGFNELASKGSLSDY